MNTTHTQLWGQPISGVVQTAHGPVRIADLSVEDRVLLSDDGAPTSISQIIELGEQPIFRIHLSDGVSVRVTEWHQWRILSRGWERTVDTRWLLSHQLERDTGWNYRLPAAGAAQYEEIALPLDPYVLGAFLGDGSFRMGGAVLTNADPAVIERVASSLPEGDSLTISEDKRSPGLLNGYVKGGADRTGSATKKTVESLGLWGLRSEEKFIPEIFHQGSLAQREALCQGLMDTDGFTPTETNSIVFGTSSPALRDGFTRLVWSLGGTASWKSRIPTYQNGQGLESFTGTICLPNEANPYYGRKAVFLNARSFGLPRRFVVGVEADGVEEARALVLPGRSPHYLADDALIVMPACVAPSG